MKNFLSAVFLLCLLALSGKAQDWKPYRQLSSAEIYHEVQKLGVTGSALYIAAHPDDENTRVLAWLANEKKVRTGYLSLTRGDGGQNLVGTEQGEALGILRTQELLAARRIDGAEQFFTRAYDFGFSKSPEETFRFWNKDSILSDVVWVIRKFRPDIIITRFPTTGEGGHGHHTASAILAVEAFDAAADPNRFPEQLEYVQPWQAKRLFWNTFNFGSGGPNTTDSSQLRVDVGGYNALLGKSYGEIAAQARSMHKSQGFGTALQRGSSIEYFKQLKGAPVKNDLFEGIDLTWGRFEAFRYLHNETNQIETSWNFVHPEENRATLLTLLERFQKAYQSPVTDNAEKKLLSQHVYKITGLINQLSGIWGEARVEEAAVAPGRALKVSLQMLNRSQSVFKTPLVPARTYKGESLDVSPDSQVVVLAAEMANLNPGQLFTDTTYYTQSDRYIPPVYWLEQPRTKALFGSPPVWLRCGAEAPYPEVLRRVKTVEGSEIPLPLPLVIKTTDPVKGEIYQPLQILPEVTLDILAHSLVFENYKPKLVFVKVKCHADSISGFLSLDAPDGWAMQTGDTHVKLRKGQDTTIPIQFIPSKSAVNYFFRPEFVSGEKRFNQHARLIHHPHIPDQTYLSEARAYVTAFPLEKGNAKRIGYITGAGDEVPEALRNVGYIVTELSENEVMNTDLNRFDAIVTGVRAYNTQDWLQAAYPRLMDYVKRGGNLVVQYNTNSRIGPVKAQIGPDTFTISRDRVTDERAPVTFLVPQHPALNSPNKITGEDFEDWFQERSIYHAANWSPAFTPLLSMADAGEKPSSGSLIVMPYGKGNFAYTGLVFFRELPAGIPGAYRLFANLLALPKR